VFFPSKSGWAWKVKTLNGQDHVLAHVRASLGVELVGLVGASVSGNIGLSVDYSKDKKNTGVRDGDESATLRVQGAPDKAFVKRKPGVAWADAAANAGEGSEAEAGAGAEAFAGARVTGSLTGKMEWYNTNKKAFKDLAQIGPSFQAQAGAGAAVQLMVTWQGGKLRVKAYAGLCLGVGAKGTIDFAVNVGQIMEFGPFLSSGLYAVGHTNLKILLPEGYKAYSMLSEIALREGIKLSDAFKKHKKDVQDYLNKMIKFHDEQMKMLVNPDNRHIFSVSLFNDPDLVLIVPPDASGRILNSLCDIASYPDMSTMRSVHGPNGELINLPLHKAAAIQVLNHMQLKSELDNALQRFNLGGEKGDTAEGRSRLISLLSAGSADPALNLFEDIERRIHRNPTPYAPQVPNYTRQYSLIPDLTFGPRVG